MPAVWHLTEPFVSEIIGKQMENKGLEISKRNKNYLFLRLVTEDRLAGETGRICEKCYVCDQRTITTMKGIPLKIRPI